TEDYALENGFSVDRTGFETSMQLQRERARSARQEGGSMKIQGGPLANLTVKSDFVGYTELVTSAKIIAIILNDQEVDLAGVGQVCHIVLDRTPFYAESGGQVSDHGIIKTDRSLAKVEDVTKAPHGQHVHRVKLQSGSLRKGDLVEASVARDQREAIIKNHTATHLLQKALKEVLGDHVNQAGSLVEPDRLRFDFSHFSSITADEMMEIEHRVNQQIWKGTELTIEYKPILEAKAMGAMALFGEKYGDVVRVVQVGDYSLELCGGCHVNNTAQIGLFKLMNETGIGSGVRRIEAVTGRHAYLYLEQQLKLLKEAAQILKSSIHEVPRRIDGILTQMKELSRENETLGAKLGNIEAGSITDQVKTIHGISVLIAKVAAKDMDSLRNIVDQVKDKLGSAIIVLGAVSEDKVNLVGAVTADLLQLGFHAGKIIKEVATRCGGGGGGRADMAQAGGKDASKLEAALEYAKEMISEKKDF
ncbi:MAG TPA: alanine--tRNA ligase, partial [Bacilli bacterium]